MCFCSPIKEKIRESIVWKFLFDGARLSGYKGSMIDSSGSLRQQSPDSQCDSNVESPAVSQNTSR